MPSNILKQHADYLREFWKLYGTRREVSNADWHETIAALQKAGEFTIVYNSEKASADKRRAKFDKDKNKRQRYMFKKGDKCFACGGMPQVRHHIIWIKNGGRNNKRNMCFLCHACHAEIHPWLQYKRH